ncbi:histidine kinase dimerization/phosphoacceptor domain -containing protein [Endothiovibrio diazotrophicus]
MIWRLRPRDLPLGYKLILMMTAVIAVSLVTAFLALASGGLSLLRQQLGEELHSQAAIVAANSRAALVFGDAAAARETLASLETVPAVVYAVLHDAGGERFADFRRGAEPPPTLDLRERRDGYFFIDDYVVAYQPVELRGKRVGGVLLVAGQHHFRDLAERYAIYGGAPFVAALLVALALTAGAQRHISAPLRRLADLMAEVQASGDFRRRAEVVGRDEIGTLAAGFNGMLEKLRERDLELARHRINLEEEVAVRTAELGESEARFRQLAENVAEVFWMVEVEDGRVSYVSPVFETIWGEPCAALYANPWLWLERVHEEDRPAVAQGFREALERGEAFSAEYRVVRGDGRVRWISDGGAPVRDGSGRLVRFAGTARDDTERREAEEQVRRSLGEKEVLLREIHHRVKNNMQVISSLLSMQGQYVDDEETRRVLEDSRSRVRSMALVHEKLYQTEDFSRIDFADYLRGLVSNVVGAYAHGGRRIALHYDLEPLGLGLDVAIPCGLITNELISNAVKYAFPERNGEIRVALHRCDFDGAPGIELVVADDGIGLPPGFDCENAPSLGLRLVTQLTRHQLRGRVVIDLERGSEFRVLFPE